MATSFSPMTKKFRKEEVLEYHAGARPGKIEVVPTKPTATARDLSLAYTPGVAEPCLEIARDKDLSYAYTTRGNLVAVVSNGTAVLGLGDIGPYAAKPVMEGKGVLFKKFADIDVFDLNIEAREVDHFCSVVKALEPTFGGINLEDVKAPECFVIEERLQKEMQIPVFHDDQHGTAIVTVAALLNALKVTRKNLSECTIVFSGSGASAIACAKLIQSFGKLGHMQPAGDILLCDSKGIVHKGRKDLNDFKRELAGTTNRHGKSGTLADALRGADVFIGLSQPGIVTQEMVRSMNPSPIIFAMANPVPEIMPHDAREAGAVVVATGRSDFLNQINNVLAFPGVFRGALDVRASAITERMKLDAAVALAAVVSDDELDENHVIPSVFDPRVMPAVAAAVARAARADGVARR